MRPSHLTQEHTVDYLIYLVKTLGSSRVKCKMAAQSFAFFFRHALNKPYKVPAILFPAHRNKLPAVMSMEELGKVIDGVGNTKHRTLLSLMYGTGMRLSEIANLRIDEVDGKQMRIRITEGKGKKDRYVPLPASLLQVLREYYKQHLPVTYLFNGSGKGKKYAPRTIQHIMQRALIRAGLGNKDYSVHTIRHSFATHLLDNGADLPAIQELMGHHHIAQTMQYLHLSAKRMAAITNPYDVLVAARTPGTGNGAQ